MGVLIGLLAMFNTSVTLHLYLSIIVLSLFAVMVIVLRPYIDDMVNRGHFFCSFALIVMMASQLALLSSPDGDKDPASTQLEGEILRTITMFVFSGVGLSMGGS